MVCLRYYIISFVFDVFWCLLFVVLLRGCLFCCSLDCVFYWLVV